MLKKLNNMILILGGGDVASGVAAVLHRHGWQIVISELPEPLVVRRKVAFAEAVWEGEQEVEGILAVLTISDEEIKNILSAGKIAVVVDPDAQVAKRLGFEVIVDARMLKRFQPIPCQGKTPLIGLGPGFIAGENCLAAVETNRGENLGKILWQGSPEADTGVPAVVEGHGLERVLYSPVEGIMKAHVQIGDFVTKGQILAEVGGAAIVAPFDGLVRGMLRDGLSVGAHVKVGDIDPRTDPDLAIKISDKALITGQSVLQIIESLS